MNINNNMNRQSFGMLKVSPDAKDFLVREGESELKNLAKIADEMKDFKHYDLVVSKDGYAITPRNPKRKSFIDPVIARLPYQEDTIELQVTATTNVENTAKYLFRYSEKEYPGVLKTLEKAGSSLLSDIYAAATELLETVAKKDAADKAQQLEKAENLSKLADSLISKFGINA